MQLFAHQILRESLDDMQPMFRFQTCCSDAEEPRGHPTRHTQEFRERHGYFGWLREAVLHAPPVRFASSSTCHRRHLCEPFEWKRWCGWAHTCARFQFACSLLLIMWSAIEALHVLHIWSLGFSLRLQGWHQSVPDPGRQSERQSSGFR